jgi:quinol monooxygenase YgiN
MTEQEKEEQKFEQLLQRIAPQSKLRRRWPLKGGISAQMTAFEVLQLDGQTKKMIRRSRLRRDRSLKQIRDATAKEFKTLQLINASEGSLSCQLLRYINDQEGVVVIEVWQSVAHHQASAKNIPQSALQLAMQLMAGPPKGSYSSPKSVVNEERCEVCLISVFCGLRMNRIIRNT